MFALLFFILGIACLVIGLICMNTKNVNLLKYVVRRKPDEEDDAFLKRGTKAAFIIGAAMIVCGMAWILF